MAAPSSSTTSSTITPQKCAFGGNACCLCNNVNAKYVMINLNKP